MDWKGLQDSTPPSSTKQGPADAPDAPEPKGDAWKGQPDSTPSSKPKDPDKE